MTSSPRPCGWPERGDSLRQVRQPFYELGQHIAIELPGARALFTTRRGGFSSGPYESLNLGRRTDDDPEAVARNRAALHEQVGVEPRFVSQVHGSTVMQIREGSPGPLEPARADGQATKRRDVAPSVLVADCLPVALAGDGAVAMLHAGWRGLAGAVIAAGVEALGDLGVHGPYAAAIGPGAGPCCYEVGAEVHEAFAELPAAVHLDRKLDLKAIARLELLRAGVAEVHDVGICTICSEPTVLFSHRRDRGVTGRQAGVAWLT
jgi:polyphenol oxidase